MSRMAEWSEIGHQIKGGRENGEIETRVTEKASGMLIKKEGVKEMG